MQWWKNINVKMGQQWKFWQNENRLRVQWFAKLANSLTWQISIIRSLELSSVKLLLESV